LGAAGPAGADGATIVAVTEDAGTRWRPVDEREDSGMSEDPREQPPEARVGDEPPSEGSGTTDDDGGAERAGLGRSAAEDKISE
jgi:hypothetical protein